jgi:hypothetical protein
MKRVFISGTSKIPKIPGAWRTGKPEWLKDSPAFIDFFTQEDGMFTNRYWDIAGNKHISLNVKDGDFDRLMSHLESKNATFFGKHRWPEKDLGKPGGFGVVFIPDPDGIPVEPQEEFAAGAY